MQVLAWRATHIYMYIYSNIFSWVYVFIYEYMQLFILFKAYGAEAVHNEATPNGCPVPPEFNVLRCQPPVIDGVIPWKATCNVEVHNQPFFFTCGKDNSLEPISGYCFRFTLKELTFSS